MSNSTAYQKTIDWFIGAWEKRDKRVDDWPMMSSPLPTMCMVAAYLTVVLKLGPLFMKNRQPYNLRGIMVVYNIIMVVWNACMCYSGWSLGWGADYNWNCEPLDRSLSPRSLKIAGTVWLFYICKFVDWFDTLFFILRKKFTHVSALHVYHHSATPSFAWIAVRYMPGGHATFGGFLNTIVHTIMHTYYAISAMGPEYQKYLWWKRYITVIQLAQLAIGFIHALQVFVFECGIDLPYEWSYFFFAQGLLFIYLFVDFYKKAYKTKNDVCEKVKAKGA